MREEDGISRARLRAVKKAALALRDANVLGSLGAAVSLEALVAARTLVAWAEADFDVPQAAAVLGLSVPTLYARLAKLKGLPVTSWYTLAATIAEHRTHRGAAG